MDKNRNDKESKSRIQEKMLVIVNRDWSRTYAATVNTFSSEGGDDSYSARCDMKNTSIISAAENKFRLSENMDELATIIEDRMSRETPKGTTEVAGLNYFLS